MRFRPLARWALITLSILGSCLPVSDLASRELVSREFAGGDLASRVERPGDERPGAPSVTGTPDHAAPSGPMLATAASSLVEPAWLDALEESDEKTESLVRSSAGSRSSAQESPSAGSLNTATEPALRSIAREAFLARGPPSRC